MSSNRRPRKLLSNQHLATKEKKSLLDLQFESKLNELRGFIMVLEAIFVIFIVFRTINTYNNQIETNESHHEEKYAFIKSIFPAIIRFCVLMATSEVVRRLNFTKQLHTNRAAIVMFYIFSIIVSLSVQQDIFEL